MPYKDPQKQKEWREKNREYLMKYRKEYMGKEENREKFREYFRSWCKKNKDKINAYSRRWYSEHLIEQRERGRLYRTKNPEKAYIRKKLWRLNNPEKFQISSRRYMSENANARIANGLRARLILAVKAQNAQKSGNTEKLLGCTIPELLNYIESKFSEGMEWGNWGKNGWHIDHIKPCYSFNLVDTQEQKRCFHYTNLQPLWAFDNLSKGKRLYATAS